MKEKWTEKKFLTKDSKTKILKKNFKRHLNIFSIKNRRQKWDRAGGIGSLGVLMEG